MSIKNICFFGCLVLLLFTCREDEVLINEPILVATENPILLPGYTAPFQSVNASVFGQILNEDNVALEGVNIEVEGHETTSDENGLFSLFEVNLNAEGSLVKASYEGYILGSRTIYPQEGSSTRVKINLIPKILTDFFGSDEGAVIEVLGGGSISFEPNSIVYAGGGAYNGNVNVFAKVLDPSKNATATEMPGDLSGIRPTDSYSETGLVSFGMLSVELYSDDGRKLQLKENTSAQVSIPISEALDGDIQSTISLWYYNEEVAKWVEEGEATLENGVYTGTVKHFSFWSCNIRVQRTLLSLTFEDSSGRPISGLEVFVKAMNAGIQSGITNADGKVFGLVPANVPLGICTGAIVNGETWSTELMPLSAPTGLSYTLDFSEISDINPKFKVITANLTCGGQNVEAVLLKVVTNEGTFFFELNNQPIEFFYLLSEGEQIQSIQFINLTDRNSSQEILIFENDGILSIRDYEMCYPENEEFVSFRTMIGGQWELASDLEMSNIEFVSPGVIEISGSLAPVSGPGPENLFTINIHDPAGIGDYSEEITVEGRTFARANVAIGGEEFSFYAGSPNSFRLTSFDNNGFITGEFSGQVILANTGNNPRAFNVFGRFRVKYEEPVTEASSFLDVVINRHRHVQRGLTGKVIGNSFITDMNSLPAPVTLEFNGNTIGDYANRNTVAHFFNLLDFEILPNTMEEFEVTEFEDVGGFVNGRFSGESQNPNYFGDDTFYSVEGIFSILNQE